MNDPELVAAWHEFLTVMDIKDSDMTLGEKLLFQIAFEKGRRAQAQGGGASVLSINSGRRLS